MDDLTFKVQFGGDGVARLRDKVKEKLKEFMGDYTDDTLVEYVIVLLKNGRRKVEAKNELNVFLGDDSDSFVSWLWDHLQSNIDLYVQPDQSCQDEAAKHKSTFGEQGGRTTPRHMDPEPEKEKSNQLSKRRHTKEWKGLVRDSNEPPPLRSAVIANIHREEEEEEGTNYQSIDQTKRSYSHRQVTHRKRSRPNERPRREEVVSKSGAPRRLLQFAVRDAVATSRPSSLTTEPSFKRLRSVVSTSTDDSSLKNQPQPVSRVPNAMSVAIKAVSEAAKDVFKVKVKPSRNVFDRLGRATDLYDSTNHLTEHRDPSIEYDGEYRGLSQVQEETTQSIYHQSPDKNGYFIRNMSMLESDAEVGSEFVSDEDYDNVIVRNRRAIDVSETGTSGLNKDDNSLMVQYNVANRVNEAARDPRNIGVQLVATSAANTSSKISNVLSYLNTQKPSHYQEARGVDVKNQKPVQDGVMKENGNPIPVSVTNGNAVTVVAQTESQKTLPSAGIYATGRPTEDADSRTIFVSNVHFGATKDSLSRHFNKFGEVLKVVIVTDAATGQPKGSAYVEFMRTEAAEHALSLDGTSFMSRILKVVRKSSAQQEAGSTVTWPRAARGSPFGGSRFIRAAPYPRGISSMYRGRLPLKPGARSLQWKRGDAQSSTPSESSSISSNNPFPSPTSRSLTYVRTEPKTNGDSGPA